MENCKTCTVAIQHTYLTPYEIVDESFETTCLRKFHISQSKMELVVNLLESYGAVYNAEDDVYVLPSEASFNCITEYLYLEYYSSSQ